MSKTYLKPINTPEDVAITYKGNLLSVKGKLGEESLEIHPDVEILKKDSHPPIFGTKDKKDIIKRIKKWHTKRTLVDLK